MAWARVAFPLRSDKGIGHVQPRSPRFVWFSYVSSSRRGLVIKVLSPVLSLLLFLISLSLPVLCLGMTKTITCQNQRHRFSAGKQTGRGQDVGLDVVTSVPLGSLGTLHVVGSKLVCECQHRGPS